MPVKISLFLTLAILVGLIHVFPFLLFPRELGAGYRGVALLGQPDAENYLTELREAYRGNYNLGNGVLYEHKTEDGAWLTYVPENLVGWVGQIMQIKLLDMVTAMNFFLPLTIFILLFFLTFLLTKNFMVSILAALVAVFMPHFFWGYSEILKPYLGLKLAFYAAFLPLNRPFNPQLVIIPFLIFLIAFVLFLQKPTTKRAMVAGVVLGLDFYFYFFWSYLYPQIGFIFLLALPTRSKALLRGLILIVAISAAVAFPVAAHTFAFFSAGSSRLLDSAFVATPTHRPIIGTVEIWVMGLLLLLGLLYLRRKIARVPFLFLFSLMAASLLVMNQQIVTGVIVQPHHYTLYLNPMMVAVAISVAGMALARWFYQCLKKFIPLSGRVLSFFVVLPLIIFAIAEGYAFQFMSYNWIKGSYASMQNQAGVMAWLNRNSPEGSVVLGYINNWSFDQVPIYTKNNLYVSLHGRHYPAPSQDEFRDRLANYAWVLGMDKNTFAYMISDAGGFHYLFWGFRYFHPQPAGNYFTYDEAPILAQALADDWVARYEEKLKRDMYQEVRKYRLDYILYGPKSNPFFTINPIFLKHLTPVFEDAAFILYKVK